MKKKVLGIFICTLLIFATVIPVAGNIKTGYTSPLAPINTSVDTISPYNIPSSPLIITATGPSDLDDVTLYYRWSRDNISWTGVKEFSIFEGFESGSQNTSLWNTYQTGGNSDARIQFNYGGTTHSGSYSCAMDDFDMAPGDSASNELYTVYDFTGASNINIDFWQYDADDEETDYGDSWPDHVNCDAVSFTNDGNTWYEIIDAASLNSDDAWSQYTYNISSDPDFNSDVTSSFAIKFQQWDNYQINLGDNWDGRVWDDISIEYITGAPSKNWSLWDDSSNPDTSYPWSWNFEFPNSYGYYEFYSIGKKTGEDDETAPLVADAQCRFNRMPEIFDENPIDGSTGVEILPQLEISISDSDSDIMTIDWYSNSSGSWQVFATDSDVGDGTYSQINDDFNRYGTTYWWYVTVTDDIYTNSSPIFHFTTEENLPPYTPSDPDPLDGATDVPVEDVLQWTGGDPNPGDKVTYDVYFGKNSPPPLVDEDLSQPAYDPGTMDLDTTYYWRIVAEDLNGLTSTGPIWHFTTELEPNGPPTKPEIYGSSNGPPGKELSWAFISDDPDDNQVKYIIEWGDGTSDETDYYQDNTLVEVPHTYGEEGDYTIKAKAEDEKGLESQEGTFSVKIKVSRMVYHPFLLRLLVRFPLLERLLALIRVI